MGKILFIYPTSAGGIYRITENFVNEIQKKYSKNIIVEKIANKEIPFSSSSKVRFVLLRNTWSICVETWSALRSKTEEFEYVYSPSILILFVVMLCSSNKKLFYHYHGETYHYWKSNISSPNIVIKFFYLFPIYTLLYFVERFTVSRLRKVFCAAAYSVDQFANYFPNYPTHNVCVVPSGVSNKVFYASRGYRTVGVPNLIYFGRIDKNKGLDALAEAILLLEKKIKLNFIWMLATTNQLDYETRTIRLIKRLKINQRIYLNPKYGVIARVLRSMTLSILPSFSEHLPNSFIESISSGVPMLTTPVGELPKVQKKISDALLIRKPEPSEIANSVERYLKLSVAEKRNIRKQCLLVAKEYSLEKSAERIFQLVNS